MTCMVWCLILQRQKSNGSWLLFLIRPFPGQAEGFKNNLILRLHGLSQMENCSLSIENTIYKALNRTVNGLKSLIWRRKSIALHPTKFISLFFLSLLTLDYCINVRKDHTLKYSDVIDIYSTQPHSKETVKNCLFKSKSKLYLQLASSQSHQLPKEREGHTVDVNELLRVPGIN